MVAQIAKLYTFGDSILDCGHFNEFGLTPGQLLVKNDDRLFPEFTGKDLTSRTEATLIHRARNGSMVKDLPFQAKGTSIEEPAIAILTVGGNDIIANLGNCGWVKKFEACLDEFVRTLPIRPIFIGNVYDPSLGNNDADFVGIDPKAVRATHALVNAAIASVARRYGQMVDLHAHFLKGDPAWFVQTIEPSLTGASEVRRCFLPHILKAVA